MNSESNRNRTWTWRRQCRSHCRRWRTSKGNNRDAAWHVTQTIFHSFPW